MLTWAIVLFSISFVLILLRHAVTLYGYLSFRKFLKQLKRTTWLYDKETPEQLPMIHLTDYLSWPNTMALVRCGSKPPFGWNSIGRPVGDIFFGLYPSDTGPPSAFTIFFPSKGKIRWEGREEQIPADVLDATPHVRFVVVTLDDNSQFYRAMQ